MAREKGTIVIPKTSPVKAEKSTMPESVKVAASAAVAEYFKAANTRAELQKLLEAADIKTMDLEFTLRELLKGRSFRYGGATYDFSGGFSGNRLKKLSEPAINFDVPEPSKGRG